MQPAIETAVSSALALTARSPAANLLAAWSNLGAVAMTTKTDEEEGAIEGARDHINTLREARKIAARELLAAKHAAIQAACARAMSLPVVDGKLELYVVVYYAKVSAEAGESDWADTPQGDETGRILLIVRDGKNRTIDMFYGNEGKAAVRPSTAAPLAWWTEPGE